MATNAPPGSGTGPLTGSTSSPRFSGGVKTRSRFTLTPPLTGDSDDTVRENVDYTLTAHIGPIRVNEPARVLAVSTHTDRHGFAYGTLEGHPVCGDEACIVHRVPDGSVWLTLRSLTRPAGGAWRIAFPALLIAQRYYRRRYRKALLQRVT